MVEEEESIPETEAVSKSLLDVPALQEATIRYIGFDPAISCGFSIIQLNSSLEILSIDVGVIDVSEATKDGHRCLLLQEQLIPLLSPTPDHAFIEPFFGHGRPNEAISYKLRAIIEMQLAAHNVDYSEVKPQTVSCCDSNHHSTV